MRISTAIHRAMDMLGVIILISFDLMKSDEWYQQIQGRVGFIIISEIPEFSELDSETMYARLHDRQGLEHIINYRMQVMKRKHTLLSPGRW
jgi:hypothetical protein